MTLDVQGGTWNQNTNLLVSSTNFTVSLGTWNQHVDLTSSSLSLSNATYNQHGMLDLDNLNIVGGTFTFGDALRVTNTFVASGVNLIQNADLTLPTDDMVVDGWIWTLNMTDAWDQVSIVNGGLLTHSLQSNQLETIPHFNVVLGKRSACKIPP